jgi:hypothetical protein
MFIFGVPSLVVVVSRREHMARPRAFPSLAGKKYRPKRTVADATAVLRNPQRP